MGATNDVDGAFAGRAYQLRAEDGAILRSVGLPIRPYGAVGDARTPQRIWFSALHNGGLVGVRVDDGTVEGPYQFSRPGCWDSEAYGVTVDASGRIWRAGALCSTPTSFDPQSGEWCIVETPTGGDTMGIAARQAPDGSTTMYAAHPGASVLSAWDPEVPCETRNVCSLFCASWSANGCTASVLECRDLRYYPSEAVQTIPLLSFVEPWGVGVDAENRIWAVNQGSEDIAVYDPEDGSVVTYPSTAWSLPLPYTYSDFTGYQRAVFSDRSGEYWHDYGVSAPACPLAQAPTWGDLTWRATVPEGTRLRFYVQASDDATALPFAPRTLIGTVPADSPPIYVDDYLSEANRRSPFVRIVAELFSSEHDRTPVLDYLRLDWVCVDET